MHVHTQWIPECNSLPFKHPHLMGESGDEWRLAEELLLWDRPEVSAGQVLGWSASLQVVLSVQPPQPQQLTVTVEGVPTKRQRKRRGGHDPRRGQDLLVRNNDVFFFKLTLTKRYLPFHIQPVSTWADWLRVWQVTCCFFHSQTKNGKWNQELWPAAPQNWISDCIHYHQS